MKKLTIEKEKVSWIATGFTDGTVIIKRLQLDKEKVLFTTLLKTQVHAFGVNCIDLIKEDEQRVILVTGGDD